MEKFLLTSVLNEVAYDLEKSERLRDSHMAEAQDGARIFQSGVSNLGNNSCKEFYRLKLVKYLAIVLCPYGLWY